MESTAVRQSNNVWSIKYFAIALGAMMVIFIVHHWLGVLYFKYGSRKPGQLTGAFVHWHRCVHTILFILNLLIERYRSARKTLDRTIYGLHLGRWLLYMVYWAINLILILTNVDLGNLNYVCFSHYLKFMALELIAITGGKTSRLVYSSSSSFSPSTIPQLTDSGSLLQT